MNQSNFNSHLCVTNKINKALNRENKMYDVMFGINFVYILTLSLLLNKFQFF